jgi:hypothetical protein
MHALGPWELSLTAHQMTVLMKEAPACAGTLLGFGASSPAANKRAGVGVAPIFLRCPSVLTMPLMDEPANFGRAA